MNVDERALVEVEVLRIAEVEAAAAIRRWLMPFSSGTHWIGGVLVFSQFWAVVD